MRLLLDANLSPALAGPLAAAGHEVVHVAAIGLVSASDAEIFDRAAADGFVVVTADADFPALLALRRASAPSVVHLRHVAQLAPAEHAALLLANLAAVEADLERGAIVSLSPTRLAVRALPLR